MPDAVLTESAATETTDYTVLDTAHRTRIYSLYMEATGGGADVLTNLKMTVTVDGVSNVHTQASVTTDTKYYPIRNPDLAADGQLASTTVAKQTAEGYMYEGDNVKVVVQCTTTAPDDKIDLLEGRVKYGVLD